MIVRLLAWLGCSVVGGVAVLLSFSNGLPNKSKEKPLVPPAAKAQETKEAAHKKDGLRKPLDSSHVEGNVTAGKD